MHSNNLENFQKLTVVMHAGGTGGSALWHSSKVAKCPGCKNNMLMMTDNTCTVMNIPKFIYPVDVVTGIEEIKSILVEEDWQERHFAHTNGTLSESIQRSLHPDFQHLCQGKNYESFDEIEITKEKAELLRAGDAIYNNKEITPTCGIRVKQQFILYIKLHFPDNHIQNSCPGHLDVAKRPCRRRENREKENDDQRNLPQGQ